VSSEYTEKVVSSFFEPGYFTLLDVEIKHYATVKKSFSKRDLNKALKKKGYAEKDINHELDRQRNCSTIRYLPDKDKYVGLDIGKALWGDICYRINEQPSLLAGRIHCRKGLVTLDVYRTDFQPHRFRRIAVATGLLRAPVMRRTGRLSPEETSRCLRTLLPALPEATCEPGDYATVIQKIGDKVERKPSKKPWAWLIVHSVVEVDLTPWRKAVLRTLFSLTNGPASWKGTPISLYELTGYLDASSSDIEEPLTYFLKTGIVQNMENDYSPTERGYTLLSGIFRSLYRVTFAITRCGRYQYRLEVSTPNFFYPEIRDLLIDAGGRPLKGGGTPVVFSPDKYSQVMKVIEALMKTMAAIEDQR
jgi:hypothetical protein